MTQIDAVSRAYLIAGLRLGNEIDGFVDNYHGPDELVPLAAEISVSRALDDLDLALEQLEPSIRRTYLEVQARALRMASRVAAGETIDYREQVSESFDIEPEWVDESVFEAAHSTLDRLLPGSGPLADRRQRYRAQFEIDAERIPAIANRVLADLRDRTMQFVELPQGESVELRLVANQPWSGYNWYLGNYRSRIEINTDLPSRLNDLPDLLAHEAYAGHHTEQILKEAHLLHEKGYGEAAIALLTSPQAVVSEGIATSAFDVVVPAAEQVEWLRGNVYEPAGFDTDIGADLAIAQAGRTLSHVPGNAALLMHAQARSSEDAVEYLMRFGLRSEVEAHKSIEFLTHPLFRTYVFTYTSGYDLVSTYLQSQPDRQAGLRALLSEHWTPSRLRGAGRQRSSDDERLPL